MTKKTTKFPPEYIFDAENIGYTVHFRKDNDTDEEGGVDKSEEETKYNNITRFFLDTSHGSPIGLRTEVLETEPDSQNLWGYIRTTSWDFDGERSDLHDLISSIVAITLRHSCISTSLPTLIHPLGELSGYNMATDIYAKYITFERHKLFSFDTTNENLNIIRKILLSTRYSAFLMDYVLSYTAPHVPVWRNYQQRAEQIAKYIDKEYDENLHNYMARDKPFWGWFRSSLSGISVFELGEAALATLRYFYHGVLSPKIIQGIKRQIILTEDLGNAVSLKRLEVGQALLDFLGDNSVEISIIPIEDRFFLLGDRHIISIDDNCGEEGFKEERDAIRLRNEQERSILFPFSQFLWRDNIDGERFERMVKDLLEEEPEITRVRRVSGGNEGDGGRDLEVEWRFVKRIPTPYVPTENPYETKKILVQCKGYKRNVNKENVRDIRDTIDMHNADGYHLVVSSQLTTQLFDYLSSLRKRGLQIDWWTRDDIEIRLRKNPSIVERYLDIVRPV